MQRFARWHIWLGWLIGVPFLIWTISGLAMIARPIEETRGDHLRSAIERKIDPAQLAVPRVGEPILSAELIQKPEGPAWIVTTARGARYSYSALDGSLDAPMTQEKARLVAESAYRGDAALAEMRYFAPGEAPMDYRAGRAAWQARFADGTHVYVDDATGEVLALRTSWWRFYDFMWGLHIMDLQGREDMHHPVLILFAALGVAGSMLGCILLFRRRKSRVRTTI
ncbi:hypothetical protein WYH_00110 [Croceibacterium atlanticum]|uniref:PepSY domain-containing protein n=2 Tax=Croceibacterium atlanticum TaxID=1267766 RepID=A0A0F7KPW8_9SPHN|nr:hypothetical protein WYH_00110 [Croceibacterium atlanticum]